MDIFDLTYDAELQSTIAYPSIEVRFGDGYSQAADNGLNNPEETWTLNFSFRNLVEKQAIDDFIANHRGSISFLWTPPDETVAKKWTIEQPVSRSQKRGGSNIPYYYQRSLKFKRVYR